MKEDSDGATKVSLVRDTSSTVASPFRVDDRDAVVNFPEARPAMVGASSDKGGGANGTGAAPPDRGTSGINGDSYGGDT